MSTLTFIVNERAVRLKADQLLLTESYKNNAR